MVESAVAAVQDATPVGPVVTVLQLVVVQEFKAVAVIGEQEDTPVGPVAVTGQVVVV